MKEGQPSSIAISAAIVRAAHLILDDDPKIFEDRLAFDLSGVENEVALRATVGAIETESARYGAREDAQVMVRYGRVIPILRQRYAEDELEKALARDVTQYVILGAGLDSFAYRRTDLTAVLQVFEVDHPATQQWKRACLRQLDIPIPSNLTFVPLDFEEQTMVEGLQTSGHWPELPTFISCLGLTHFLTAEAVFEMLRNVATLAPGSEIVFDYYLPESLLDEEARWALAISKKLAAARGEPLKSGLSGFEPSVLAAQVKELGFTQVWNVGSEEANARYFAGRTDGLCAPPISNIMKVRVGRV